MCEGCDFWGCLGEIFIWIEGNFDILLILKDGDDVDKERLWYMFDWDGLSVGFSDYMLKDE